MKTILENIVIGFKPFFIVLFCCSLTYSQTPEELFQQGNEDYAQGNYQEAVTNYEKVVESGNVSASLYYNLANSYYKLNRVAPSVYNYEKALLLKPNDADIKNNLSFAQNMTVDAITPLPQNTFKKWYNSALSLFTTDGWAVFAVVLILLFMVSFIAYYFVFTTLKKRLLFITSFVALALGLGGLAMAFQSQMNAKQTRSAIVFSAEAQTKSEPNFRSEEAFVLHEGTKVKVLEETEEWKRIRLADGKEGWIPTTDIKEL